MTAYVVAADLNYRMLENFESFCNLLSRNLFILLLLTIKKKFFFRLKGLLNFFFLHDNYSSRVLANSFLTYRKYNNGVYDGNETGVKL